MSDAELPWLGIQTIGNRICLRSACRRKNDGAQNITSEANTPSTATSSSSSSAATIASERAIPNIQQLVTKRGNGLKDPLEPGQLKFFA